MEKSKKEFSIDSDDAKDKKKFPDEWIKAQVLKPLEIDRLDDVFKHITQKDMHAKVEYMQKETSKEKKSIGNSTTLQLNDITKRAGKITEGDLKILMEIDLKTPTKLSEIKDMIWVSSLLGSG